jgi:glycosyltransferase involved in cell wall biosynthesis
MHTDSGDAPQPPESSPCPMAPKVSVLLLTYNHERFIEEAITSALTQEMHAEHEIVVAEDCSTDGTRTVLLRLQGDHPGRLRLLLRERNVGLQRNFASALAACRGEYVAMLDGDDVWTSPHKLRKQTDYLDAHPECAMCCHGAVEVSEDGGTQVSGPQPETLTLADMLRENFCYSSSAMFRRRLVPELPEWFYSLVMEDQPTFVIAARHGTIGYLNETMLTYRVHRGGAWSGLSPADQVREEVRMYEAFREFLGHGYDDVILARIEKCRARLRSDQ